MERHMSGVLRCISPVDGSVYLERLVASDGEIERALSAARGAQRKWALRPIAERARHCRAFVDAMASMLDEIVPELAWQMGRPVRHGALELGGFEERSRWMIAAADEALAPIVPEPKAGFERYVARDPLGVVFVLAPWNYPYLTAVNSVVPALMAGNAVLLKHSSQTLAVGDRFARAAEAALPPGLFAHLVLDHERSARIISSRSIDQVNFTGSVAGGRAMEQAAAGRFIGLGLELGGKDPAYVRPDADLQQAVEGLVDGAFFNSGQSCCGIERIYVHRDVYGNFVDDFAALTREYVLGNPLDEATTLGPMATAAGADFARRQVAEALAAGARSLVDAGDFERDTAGSPYMAPQVVDRVDHGMALMVEESFAPVVGIMKVRSDDEAIERMNHSPYGLTASLWTRDLEAARALGRGLEAGTVYMNRCDYLDPALAWTGVKDSGRGVTLSRVGYETLTRPKSFHLKYGA